ncbi:MAG: hypothetical protein ACLQU3_11540 [Limisphaerales bacterium]
MENQAPFNLDQALRQWRASLHNLGAFGTDDLEELEGHLRESISVLHAKGLSVREAFMIATRRLGSARQLSDEFAKANPQRTWTERAIWMAAGVLAAYTLSAVTAPITGIVLNCAISSGLNDQVVGALHFLTRWVVLVGTAAIAYRVISRRFFWLDRSVQACIRQPVLAGLVLFIGLECLQYGTRYATRLAEPLFSLFSGHHASIRHPNEAVISGWFFWGFYLTQLLWIAAVPLLAGYAWRKRGSPESDSAVSLEWQPGEDEAARGLQSYGLSLDEANLILARRHCQHEVVAPSLGLTTSRGIRLERAVWMVTGVALSRCLEFLVLNLGWLPVMVARPAAPFYQHLAGLASACLSLTFGLAMIAGLWRWVTRHPSQSALIGGLCRRRPLLAAIALVGVCAGIGLCEYGVFMYVAPREVIPGQSGIGPIASQWFMYSQALTAVIIPIALLLWFARRWRSLQPNPAPGR